MKVASRLIGAVITGGGSYAMLTIFDSGLGVPVILAISGAMAIAGLVFGPKAWELVVHIF